jgi:hypothetical protein
MASAIDSAKDKAKQSAQARKDEAAGRLGEMAGALRGAAGEMQKGNERVLGRMAERAADGLENVSAKLRSKDIDGLVRDAESFARSQPLAFFGVSLAAGFLAMRFLKSAQGAADSQNPQP